MIDILHKDLRFAARLMAKERSFAVVAVVVLGLGITLTNATFMVVNAWFLRQPPYEQPDRVVWISTIDMQGRSFGASYPDWRASFRKRVERIHSRCLRLLACCSWCASWRASTRRGVP